MKNLFVLVIISILSLNTMGCDDETPLSSIIGSWRVLKENISGELKTLPPPPEDALNNDISINITDVKKGYIDGNTFQNSFSVELEIQDDQQIIFESYGGTRASEDIWGLSFSNNLLNSVRYAFVGNELHFMDADEQTVIVFKKK